MKDDKSTEETLTELGHKLENQENMLLSKNTGSLKCFRIFLSKEENGQKMTNEEVPLRDLYYTPCFFLLQREI
jgi:hypothetical protein